MLLAAAAAVGVRGLMILHGDKSPLLVYLSFLRSPAFIGSKFSLWGAAPLTYEAVVVFSSPCLSRGIHQFDIPVQIVVPLFHIIELLGINLPINV